MNVSRLMRCYVQSIAEDELGFRAGALAYYATFSLFPLILLLVSVFSRFLAANEDVQGYLEAGVLNLLPEGSEIILDAIDNLTSSWDGANVIALIGLLWAASGFFRGLELSTNRIFGAEQKRPTWLSRGIGMIMAVVMGPLIFLAVMLNTISQALLHLPFLPDALREMLAATSNTAVIILILWLAFFLLYYFVPWKRPHVRPTLLGAAITALIWGTVTRIFIWYISSGWKDYSVIYGSISVVIVLFLWFYLSNFIILLGAELTAFLGGVKKCEPQPMAPLIEKALTFMRLPLDSTSQQAEDELEHDLHDAA